VRLHGENRELIDSIVELSIRYGIVTPYTSYLVTEPGQAVLTDEGRSELAAEAYKAAAAPQPVSGEAAVERAVAQSALADASQAAAVEGRAAEVVKIVGSRTFLLSDGVWIDTGFNPARQQPVQVTFASPAYFALLSARPELASAFALGPRVIALAADGTPYEVVEASVPAPDVPPTYTPPAPAATSAGPATAAPASTAAPTTLPPPQGGLPGGPALWAAGVLAPLLIALAVLRRRAG
jgi:Ca-activated chloride channel homolog